LRISWIAIAAKVIASSLICNVPVGGAECGIQEFYKHLGQPGVSKAEALRRAQAFLLNPPESYQGKDYKHPIYWAPYILIGNWL
jgi:CHAT domain-containing protein